MTTIVYRAGVMAADSRAYSGDKHPIGAKVKVRRTKEGVLIGASSTVVGATEQICSWYEKGRPEGFDLPERFSLIVAHPDGRVFVADDQQFLSGPLEADFFAIGSGEQYAYGALFMGADAIDAVRAACFSDVWTDLPIFAVAHDSAEVQRFEQ